jgi:transcriptional regulator GlxA family with amidase domain
MRLARSSSFALMVIVSLIGLAVAEETGQSPAKAIERLRVESARLMMEAGCFSAEEIARKNGFGNRERMRRSFVRAFGQSPQTIQRTVIA